MSKNVYLATTEHRAGKIAAVLGLLSLLERDVRRVGYFRPIARIGDGTKTDPNIELVNAIHGTDCPIETMFGVTHNRLEQLMSSKHYDDLLEEILEKYKAFEANYDFVLIEGTNYEGTTLAFEFDLNADIARNLGAPVILVASGKDKSPEDIVATVKMSKEIFDTKKCTFLTTIVNRVEKDSLAAITKTLTTQFKTAEIDFAGAMPEDEVLASPRMDEIADALGAEVIYGEKYLNNLAHSIRIGAVRLSTAIERIDQGMLLLTSGDRTDLLLGLMAAQLSRRMPYLAGLLLTSDIEPSKEIMNVLKGIQGPRLPILSVKTGLFKAAMQVSKVASVIRPSNSRKIETAQVLFEENIKYQQIAARFRTERSSQLTPKLFLHGLHSQARKAKKTIVLPEGEEGRILQATESLVRRNIVDVVLLGNEAKIKEGIASRKLSIDPVRIIDPSKSDKLQSYAEEYFKARQHKGMTMDHALDAMQECTYFGTMMVHLGDADGMVSGSVNTTAHTLRPSFEFIKTKPGIHLVSSVFFMCLEDRVLVYGDCAVNPNPTAQQLAEIAVTSADTAAAFGIEPRIAMLSYATGGSGKGSDVEAVVEATRIAKELRPDLMLEGPLQYDAAVDMGVARTKLPDSNVAGRATVFIFPDLNTGNNTYKAVQRSAQAIAVGPVLQGLNKPVNDLSRGCTIPDIVNTVAITAIQAQGTA